MKMQNINIRDYLSQKGIPFKDSGKELVVACVFGSCDADSKNSEWHLYFNSDTGQYDCKKCGAQGNLLTLAKHLGDIPPKSTKSLTFDSELVEACHRALPEHIRQYLHARGITDAHINEYELGWGKFYGQQWITIPIKNISGNYAFFKLRQDPSVGSKKMTYPRGIEAQLYGWEMLTKANDMVVICEGELDRLLLISKGINAVTSTHGAGTFKEEWAQHFSNLSKAYVCYDQNDKTEAGEKGALRVLEILSKIEGLKLFNITLPDEVGEGGDITDYFIKLNGSTNDLLGMYAKELPSSEKIGRIIKINKLEREVSFPEWREAIENNFPELLFSAEVGLSIIAQILIKKITNPFALVLVDVPSSGKTITINFFSEIEGLTYASDKFTPASFVSNATNVKKEKLKDIDLLPRLKYKMFLLRDLSTLFSKRDDDLNECLGLLTRVLDGEGLNTDSGVHGQRQYVGEYLFMILAGSTPIPPRVWKMMGNLGSRLFFLGLNTREKSELELAEQLTTTAYKDKERTCRAATKNFLYTLWHKHQDGVDWDNGQDGQKELLIITRCARLLAKLRGVINVWKDRHDDGMEFSYSPPVIEKPDRINQLFYNLCRGHALVTGRTQINQSDLKLIVELAIDSSPTTRAKLFRKLLENNGVIKTSEIEVALNCSKPTALKEMETLKILEIGNITHESYNSTGGPENTLTLSNDFQWFLSDECKTIRGIPLAPEQSTMADLA